MIDTLEAFYSFSPSGDKSVTPFMWWIISRSREIIGQIFKLKFTRGKGHNHFRLMKVHHRYQGNEHSVETKMKNGKRIGWIERLENWHDDLFFNKRLDGKERKRYALSQSQSHKVTITAAWSIIGQCQWHLGQQYPNQISWPFFRRLWTSSS